MINRETVDEIISAARIEEVVGDYVVLKRRGANLLGLCPFHNEKTPSFTVSPAKGIYKCFGCGKAGNPVGFIMEHEHFTYPEALRFLARKYNIEIEEEHKEYTPEELLQQNEKESLYVISSYASKFFSTQLWETDEGRNIGLSYFRERGFSDETITHFQLGYSPENRTAFSETALKEGYKPEHLENSGLGIRHEERFFDRFAGRVIFPVHSLAGRVLAFGGRTLKSDKKIAKYLNSPESPIYHKSDVLYGLFQARKPISASNICYLVEGYTDVISLYQAGIANVVASSGTSLTQGQIRLIKRYATEVVILYDGDPAGIKASLRGINLILAEGLNVKIVLFPEGEDPDSYSRRNGSEATKEFLNNGARDFIVFKAGLLLREAGGDPLKKTALIRDIIESIALIPDGIARSLYIRQCSGMFDMEESSLIHELNKARKAALEARNRAQAEAPVESDTEQTGFDIEEGHVTGEEVISPSDMFHQELDLIRLLLLYGERMISDPHPDEHGEHPEILLAHLIIEELQVDSLGFTNKSFHAIYEEYLEFYSRNEVPPLSHFINHKSQEISQAAINITSTPYAISPGWEKHNITVKNEDYDLPRAVTGAVYTLKNRHVELMKKEISELLKSAGEDEIMALLKRIRELDEVKNALNESLGRVIIK